jgi:hypothetical protein
LIEKVLIPQEILSIENGKIFVRTKDYPVWVKPVVEQLQGYTFLHD